MNRQDIINHVESYLNGQITVDALSEWYFPLFKSEPLDTPEEEHRICAALFHDLDEYVPPVLWDPGAKYCVDEDELRKRLFGLLARLKGLD